MNKKQTNQLLAKLIIAAVLISACGAAPEAVVSRLATQAAALLAPAAEPTQAYTVQPGDTLSGIALAFGTTVDNVITLNADAYPQMTDRRTLIAGWTLQVPMGAGVPSAAAANGPAAVDAVASEPTAVAVAPVQPTAAAPVRDASGGYFDYDIALEIIRLTNDERAKNGLGPLEIDEGLMETARKRAVEVVSDYDHVSRSGLFNGFTGPAWENVGGGHARSANWFVDGWMNSPGHRENILNSGVTRIGVGFYVTNRMSYAVQIFK